VVDSDSGKVLRYAISDGQLAGEIEVPQGASFDFFGEDGNLYLYAGGGEFIAVDYRNNRIERSFRFERR